MAERKARRNQAPLIDRELLAYHEAGHAVLARVLRLGLRRVTIVWDPVDESPGHCLHGRGGAVDPYFTTRAGYASNQRYIRKRGLFLYGGLAAEAIHFGKDPRPDTSADEQEIASLLYEADCASDEERSAYVERLWQEARDLLNANWLAVEALAHALLERNELNGRSAHRTMRLASKTT
jgi:ATP-dependent Zn protease